MNEAGKEMYAWNECELQTRFHLVNISLWFGQYGRLWPSIAG